jgi:hypothetical protein
MNNGLVMNYNTKQVYTSIAIKEQIMHILL